MLHIDIWADFACPACYLAKPRIDQAIAASGHADAITVTYRSFELFPDAGPEPFDSFEHVLHKFGGDHAQAARLEEHMAALARAQGQPYAIHHPGANSFDAHRMLHLAAEHGAASEFMDTVQRDLLGKGINAYTAGYLADAAARAGCRPRGQRPSWRVTSTPTPYARTRNSPVTWAPAAGSSR